MALAALLVLIVGSAVWMTRPAREEEPLAGRTGPPPLETPAPRTPDIEKAPVVFVLSLTPISVRSGGDQPIARVPPGIDVLVLDMSGEPNEPPVKDGTAIVRGVSGNEVWRGRVTAGSTPEILARARIPAERLQADDYIVELLEMDARGRQIERHRYFLRLRRG